MLKSKRGRCGEYSVMMYFMLSALGYQSRWVVDRDDHVWAEFYLSSSKEWIHIDPCEAAVNEPYIYSHWGKTPTFILAFEASKITDVTQYYIDPASLPANVTVMEAIEERRAAENVNTTYFNTMLGRGEMYLRGLRVLSRNLQ